MSKRNRRNLLLVAIIAAAVSVANMSVSIARADYVMSCPDIDCQDSHDCGGSCMCSGHWPHGDCYLDKE